VHNGSLWVTYSVDKEGIEVMRVPLGQLVAKAAGAASQSGRRSSAAAGLKTDEAFVTADCPKQGFPWSIKLSASFSSSTITAQSPVITGYKLLPP
jgi:hypothetical protein